ncbi:MAG: DNA-processing protein DprA [Elusimicrobiota bacterium]
MGLDDNKHACIMLNMIPDIGTTRIRRLHDFFNGNLQRVFKATTSELCNVEDIGKILAQRIASADLDSVNTELKLAQALGVKIITVYDDEYPLMLRYISDPPTVMYIRGSIPAQNDIPVAVVGTRAPTSYGNMVAERLSTALAELGVTTVSGLARGIDTRVHCATLNAGGKTIAVLGNGLYHHYPPENKKLEDKIIESGALISEYPLKYPPDKSSFPRRNRLISGLCLGVVVIEAGLKSGALITARLASEQGKEVFAVPGNVFSKCSQGPHMLIKQGAKLVESITDIIDELMPLRERLAGLTAETLRKNNQNVFCIINNLAEDEKLVYNILPVEPVALDSMIENTNFSVSHISQVLLQLEIKGLVKTLAGKMYLKVGSME